MIIGIISGLVGAFHGYLEIQQGSSNPNGILFDALKGGHVPMPAMTIIPNFLITGISALIVGLVILFWVILFNQRKMGGPVLIFYRFCCF